MKRGNPSRTRNSLQRNRDNRQEETATREDSVLPKSIFISRFPLPTRSRRFPTRNPFLLSFLSFSFALASTSLFFHFLLLLLTRSFGYAVNCSKFHRLERSFQRELSLVLRFLRARSARVWRNVRYSKRQTRRRDGERRRKSRSDKRRFITKGSAALSRQ